MTLGLAPRQADLFRSTIGFCEPRVAPGSIYGLLHRECQRLFPDEMFADLFTEVGRRSVPPSIVAVVMVLQRIEGCSDREAVDRFCFDARWKYAAGGLDFDYPGFVHTVLVDMRARLARSDAPDRIFEAVLGVGRAAGLVGRRRVLDSTPIDDAVATMDTVTLVRSAIGGVLRVADSVLEARVRAVLTREDDYASAGKPACDYDDASARVEMVDALAKDGMAVLGVLDGRELAQVVAQAGELLATVLGQDLDCDEAGVFRIARRVAKDRVISTVDRQARHGHKTAARGFDGYKGHVGIDPDSEIITATTVSAGNAGDASVAEDLIADLLDTPEQATPDGEPGESGEDDSVASEGLDDSEVGEDDADDSVAGEGLDDSEVGEESAAVYGDNAYGTGPLHERLEQAGIESKCKTQQPANSGGRFSKNEFDIDLEQDSVTCPAGNTAPIRRGTDGAGTASFGPACAGCPLREQCTTAAAGRNISVGVYEEQLAAARARQRHPDWVADYRATRPKVERKIGHLMRRKHGGRRARVRGQVKVAADFALLAASVNLARLAVLAVASVPGSGWATAAA
ncbi:MAG TPA: IS1182 family transposase [Kineosporiaceae bacterium]|nr:IS1182 family transposase [Kineosporiaceae bacterium]